MALRRRATATAEQETRDAAWRKYFQDVINRQVEWQYGDEWRSPFFNLCRELKTQRALRDHDGFSVWSFVTDYIAVEELTNLDTRFLSEDDTMASFISCWESVKFAEDETLLTRALELSERRPAKLLPDRGKGYQRFVALVWALATMVEPVADGGRVIAIPQEKWAETLKVNRVTIAQWCKWAAIDGIIKLESDWVKAEGAYKGQARKFRVMKL